jgi:hypothetical protein
MTRLSTVRTTLCSTIVVIGGLGLIGFGAMSKLHEWIEPASVEAQGTPVAPWTAIGASAAVDESSLFRFAFTNASAGYGANASVAPLEFRYNITNVEHTVSPNGGIPTLTSPGWTTLEFGAQAPATSIATAYFYRVNRCTGQQTLICLIQHTNTPAPGMCRVCQFPNTTVDFGNYLYYIRVVLDRNTASELPMAHTLRLY